MSLRDTVLEIPTYQRATSLVFFLCVFFFCIKKRNFPAYVITVTYVKTSIVKNDEHVHFKQTLLGGFKSQTQAQVVAILFQV